ncbi:MAG: stage V sporulation protein AE [Bacillota bacterium]
MDKRKVILVTDGDMVAKGAVEIAASNIGGRCISASAGNPTTLTGDEIVKLIKTAEHDPVVVMVDDRGYKGVGAGEEAMDTIIRDDNIDILGIVAVSSNGKDCNGLKITCSITKDGDIIEGAVDKYGNDIHGERICGDTLSILKSYEDLIIVGIGDPGKMDFKDEISKGSPVTTKALEEVIKRSGAVH